MIKIRISKAALEEFKDSEYGSYEDADCPDTGHVWCILDRHSTVIEVRDDAEAAQVYEALVTGTFQIDNPAYGQRYFRTACRISDAVRDAARRADPVLVEERPRPSGY